MGLDCICAILFNAHRRLFILLSAMDNRKVVSREAVKRNRV